MPCLHSFISMAYQRRCWSGPPLQPWLTFDMPISAPTASSFGSLSYVRLFLFYQELEKMTTANPQVSAKRSNLRFMDFPSKRKLSYQLKELLQSAANPVHSIPKMAAVLYSLFSGTAKSLPYMALETSLRGKPHNLQRKVMKSRFFLHQASKDG